MTSWPEKIFSFLGLGQYKASPVAAADGAAVPLLVDAYGKQRVIAEISGATVYSHYKPPTGPDKKGAIKRSAGSLRAVYASNKSVSGYWLLLLDLADAPAGGETSEVIFPFWVPAGESRAIELPADLAFSDGIAWAASTAMAEVTLPVGENLWVNAFYL